MISPENGSRDVYFLEDLSIDRQLVFEVHKLEDCLDHVAVIIKDMRGASLVHPWEKEKNPSTGILSFFFFFWGLILVFFFFGLMFAVRAC